MSRRRIVGVLSLLAGLVFVVTAFSASGTSAATSASPCTQVNQPLWSPDGTQIVYFGRRWPTLAGHSTLWAQHGICTMNGDGTNVQPLQYTTCGGKKCPEPPTLIAWTPSGILYTSGGAIYRLLPGSKPHKIATPSAVAYVVNPAGTRIATQKFYPGCMGCGGPVTILNASNGAVIGTAGGKKYVNVDPTLSPSGAQVAFEREAGNDSGKLFGIWTANASGSHLRQLVKSGQQPLWSPVGGQIAYRAVVGASVVQVALRVIPARGGKSRALVSRGVSTVFGWSPDGKSIAFESGGGRLAVVAVATGKVRDLLKLSAPTVSWAPDSSELVANSISGTKKCWATWRVPVDGSKATKISSCSG